MCGGNERADVGQRQGSFEGNCEVNTWGKGQGKFGKRAGHIWWLGQGTSEGKISMGGKGNCRRTSRAHVRAKVGACVRQGRIRQGPPPPHVKTFSTVLHVSCDFLHLFYFVKM